MNKTIILILLAAVLTVGVASASSLTVISGDIFDQDSNPVSAADVTVVCEHVGSNSTKATVSNLDGSYQVTFLQTKCASGDTVWVFADFDGASGESSGIVSKEGDCVVDTGIVDVRIPEFSVIAGATALIASVLGFFVLRKKR